MNHGRSRPPRHDAARLTRGTLWAFLLIPLFSAAPGLGQAPPAENRPPLRLTWSAPDHPSGVYHVKEEGALTVLVDNPAIEDADFSGEILFGSRTGAAAADFKVLAVTPIAPAVIKPGQRARIPLKLPFGAAGTYELRWKQGEASTPIAPPVAGWTLECIFAPRGAAPAAAPATAPLPASVRAALGIGASTRPEESPWITLLPAGAARHPGFLADYARRTTITRFLIDERFAFDPATNVGLGFGASTGAGAAEIDAFLADAAKAGLRLILRVTVPPPAAPGAGTATADARSLAAFRQYITGAAQRSRGALQAIAVAPAADATDAQRRSLAAYYLAAYETAKRADKNIVLLGAGSAAGTAQWLASDPKLAAYVDALAIADGAGEPLAARQYLQGAKKPLYLLPPSATEPWPAAAAGLAVGAALVPVPPPGIDHGVTAHLLGGTVLQQRLHITVPTANPAEPDTSDIPFVAVFQGDGYAVAAVAGFGAGADLDGLYPRLAGTHTRVEPVTPDQAPAHPTLLVGDDTRTMRVVDRAGAPVDCHIGDHLFVPAGDQFMYVLQGGAAAELAGTLRVATASRLPLFEVAITRQTDGLVVQVRNITTRTQSGVVRLFHSSGDQSTTSVEKDIVNLPPGQRLEAPLIFSGEDWASLRGPLVVEIRTLGNKPLIQRTALTIPAP